MAKDKVKKGKCIEITADTIVPGDGLCCNPKCTLKSKAILIGYYCVEYQGKLYHASCATQIGIDFRIPLAPKRKRVEK